MRLLTTRNAMASALLAVVAAALVACGGDRPPAPGQSTPNASEMSAAMTSALSEAVSSAVSSAISQATNASDAAPGVSAITGTWTLSTVEMTNGGVIPIPEQAGAKVVIAGTNVAISTGCNTGSAEIKVADVAAVLGPVALTKMACTSEPLTNLENATMQVMSDQPTVGVTNGQLVINGPDGTLTYNRG